MSSNDAEIFKSWGQTLSQARSSQGRDSGTLSRELMLSYAQIKGIEAGDARAFHAQSYYLRGVQRYAEYLNVELEPSVSSIKGPETTAAQRARTPQRAAGIAQRQNSPMNAMTLPNGQARGAKSGRWILLILLGLGAAGVYMAMNDGWPNRAIDAITIAQNDTHQNRTESTLASAASMLEAAPLTEQALVTRIDPFAPPAVTSSSPSSIAPQVAQPVVPQPSPAPLLSGTTINTPIDTRSVAALTSPQTTGTGLLPTPTNRHIDAQTDASQATPQTVTAAVSATAAPAVSMQSVQTQATIEAPITTPITTPIATPIATPITTPIATPALVSDTTVQPLVSPALTANQTQVIAPAPTGSDIPSTPLASSVVISAPAANPSVVPNVSEQDIVLSFREECWVEWRLNDGQAQQRIFKPGEQLSLPADQVQRLVLGNARSIQAQVSGKPLELKQFMRGAGTVARIDGTALLQAIR